MSALPIINETLTSPNNIYLKHVYDTFSTKHFTLEDLQKLLSNPDKGKKETTINIDERSNMEYNPLQCDIRVWNQGLGAQCNCQKLHNETMCPMHLSKTKNQPWWLGLVTHEKPIEPKHPKTGIHKWEKM
jgi:hypothetical protein